MLTLSVLSPGVLVLISWCPGPYLLASCSLSSGVPVFISWCPVPYLLVSCSLSPDKVKGSVLVLISWCPDPYLLVSQSLSPGVPVLSFWCSGPYLVCARWKYNCCYQIHNLGKTSELKSWMEMTIQFLKKKSVCSLMQLWCPSSTEEMPWCATIHLDETM